MAVSAVQATQEGAEHTALEGGSSIQHNGGFVTANRNCLGSTWGWKSNRRVWCWFPDCHIWQSDFASCSSSQFQHFMCLYINCKTLLASDMHFLRKKKSRTQFLFCVGTLRNVGSNSGFRKCLAVGWNCKQFGQPLVSTGISCVSWVGLFSRICIKIFGITFYT